MRWGRTSRRVATVLLAAAIGAGIAAVAPGRRGALRVRIDAGPAPSLAVAAVVAVPGSFADPGQVLRVRDQRGRTVPSTRWLPPFTGASGTSAASASSWRVLRFAVPAGVGGRQEFWIRAQPREDLGASRVNHAASRSDRAVREKHAKQESPGDRARRASAVGEGRTGPLRVRRDPRGSRARIEIAQGLGGGTPGGVSVVGPGPDLVIGIEAFRVEGPGQPPRQVPLREILRDEREESLGWVRLRSEGEACQGGGFTVVTDLQVCAGAALAEGVVRVVRWGEAGSASGIGVRVWIEGAQRMREGEAGAVAWVLDAGSRSRRDSGKPSRYLWLAGRDLAELSPKALRAEDGALVLDLWPRKHKWKEGEAERVEFLAGWGECPSRAGPPARVLRSAAHWARSGLVAWLRAADLRRLGVAIAPGRDAGPLTRRYDRAVTRLREQVRHHGRPSSPADYGDWFDRAGHPGNNEFDTAWGLLLHGLREEDPGLLHEAEKALHHGWTEDLPHGAGGVGSCGLPWMEGRHHRSGLQELGHVWLEGGLLWGFLAGDREAFEVESAVAGAILRELDLQRDVEPDRERCLGWPLLALTRAGAVTGSTGFQSASRALADRALEAQDPEGYFHIERWPLAVQAGDLGPRSSGDVSPGEASSTASIVPRMTVTGEAGTRMTTWVTSGVLLDSLACAGSSLGDPRLADAVVRGASFLARHALDPSLGRYARALQIRGTDGTITRHGEVRGAAGMLLALGFARAAAISGRGDLLGHARRAASLALDDILRERSPLAAGRELSLLLRASPGVLRVLEGAPEASTFDAAFP